MATRNVFISAGHSNEVGKDMGAETILKLKEGQLTVELRNLIIDELNILNVYVLKDADSNVTKDTVKIISNSLTSRDIAIDLHFNWFERETARGTEVLVPFKSSVFERDLAKRLSNKISNILGTINRGVKTEAESARGRLIFMTPNCENILIEVCFLSNTKDIMSYLAKKNEVAKEIADSIYYYLTK